MAPNPLLALPHADHDRARVEAELLEAVRAPTEAMTEMASHLIGAGGKRVRPLFAIASAACAHDQPGEAPERWCWAACRSNWSTWVRSTTTT